MGVIKGICISERKGTQKHEIPEAVVIKDWGLEGDAHAGKWHRQVSAFGENLIVDGFHFRTLPVGTRFRVGEVLLEMTQIGKECHSHCEIYKVMGDCIMPREGVFAKVLNGGTIHKGDIMTIVSKKPSIQDV